MSIFHHFGHASYEAGKSIITNDEPWPAIDPSFGLRPHAPPLHRLRAAGRKGG